MYQVFPKQVGNSFQISFRVLTFPRCKVHLSASKYHLYSRSLPNHLSTWHLPFNLTLKPQHPTQICKHPLHHSSLVSHSSRILLVKQPSVRHYHLNSYLVWVGSSLFLNLRFVRLLHLLQNYLPLWTLALNPFLCLPLLINSLLFLCHSNCFSLFSSRLLS